MPDGGSKPLVVESGFMNKLKSFFITCIFSKILNFLDKAWKLAVSEPKMVFHCLKVGLALSFVSFFYYMRPLYDGVGGNAMWAVMTVVVVFEYTAGATLCKCVNRVMGTFLAGGLGIGVHWVATQSGPKFEPIILGISVFILAFSATFSRFIPSIKARFDYGAAIFILTFCLVTVSGYRVEKLFELAHERLATIAIGTSICILISLLLFPVWAGTELHLLICNNLEKLADSLHGCVEDYFEIEKNDNDEKEDEEMINKKLNGYKCVLNSKATEETMANFARWEPAHGNFNFRHPWKQYIKVGALMRSCAYCIESLNGCVDQEIQAPEVLKEQFREVCMKLSSECSNVLKELAFTMKTMTKSLKVDIMVADMNFAVQDLHNTLKTIPILPSATITKSLGIPLVQVLPIATTISLLTELTSRIEELADALNQLAIMADFSDVEDEDKGMFEEEGHHNIIISNGNSQDNEIIKKTIQN
ncbi:aluminum-activated malate transporter 10 [Impatiens glandulifera]|uniref:aluminum-activated malate transporter 10 n=1 Tax=Impatiens glandulifera TaxID=253017 RepID=UPI001FB0C2D4|nr:aluminum-activated malate transporter 10 [Impatiens glandulifera]